MNQQKVDVVRLQLLQAFIDGCCKAGPRIIAHPHFGGHERVSARNARRADGGPDIRFILIHLCGINVPEPVM